jgi:hypothetical protein
MSNVPDAARKCGRPDRSPGRVFEPWDRGQPPPTLRSPRLGRLMWPRIAPFRGSHGVCPRSQGSRPDLCPHLAGSPLRVEGFACFPAPLALKAVTSHRTPQSSPFWSRPRSTVRQPGNREDRGVRRDVAALDSQRSGETGQTPRLPRRPLKMRAKMRVLPPGPRFPPAAPRYSNNPCHSERSRGPGPSAVRPSVRNMHAFCVHVARGKTQVGHTILNRAALRSVQYVLVPVQAPLPVRFRRRKQPQAAWACFLVCPT